MNADERRSRSDALTEAIIGAAYEVANTLGIGFFERVYENALTHELRKRGFVVEQQKCLQVHYDGIIVGDYVADLIVEGLVIVELKTVKQLDSIHQAQCMNYLKATGLNVSLLVNFGTSRVDVRRIVNEF
jgi:GxxExxY protein